METTVKTTVAWLCMVLPCMILLHITLLFINFLCLSSSFLTGRHRRAERSHRLPANKFLGNLLWLNPPKALKHTVHIHFHVSIWYPKQCQIRWHYIVHNYISYQPYLTNNQAFWGKNIISLFWWGNLQNGNSLFTNKSAKLYSAGIR